MGWGFRRPSAGFSANVLDALDVLPSDSQPNSMHMRELLLEVQDANKIPGAPLTPGQVAPIQRVVGRKSVLVRLRSSAEVAACTAGTTTAMATTAMSAFLAIAPPNGIGFDFDLLALAQPLVLRLK